MSRKFYPENKEEKDLISQRLRQFFFDYWENFDIDADVVRELKTPKATISRWLKGEYTKEFLEVLQKEYNLNINWLITGKGKPFLKS